VQNNCHATPGRTAASSLYVAQDNEHPHPHAQTEPESSANVLTIIGERDKRPTHTVRQGMHVRIKQQEWEPVVKGHVEAVQDSALVVNGQAIPIRNIQVLTFRYPNRLLTGGIMTAAAIGSIILFAEVQRQGTNPSVQETFSGILYLIAYCLTPIGLVLLLCHSKRLVMKERWWRVERRKVKTHW
jgi:hypothetical protein